MSGSQNAAGEKRLVELATGFALGELEKHELEELHELIRDGGSHDNRAAAVVWEALGISVDLRAMLDRQFADAVRHRLDSAPAADDDGAPPGDQQRSRSFLRSFAARVGIARPVLAPLNSPADKTANPRSPLRALLWVLPAFLLAAAPFLLWYTLRSSVSATAIAGSVTIEGRAVVPGQSLPRSPVIVAEGASLAITWPDGHRALVLGPANLVPRESALSLSSGTAWLSTRGRFTLGLPDGQAQTSAPADFAAVIIENRSMVGVSAGTAKLTVRYQQHAVHPGTAAVLDGPTFPWQPRLPWKDDRSTGTPPVIVRKIETDQDSPVWRIRGHLNWSSREDRVEILLPGSRDEKPRRIRLTPGIVEVTSATATRRYTVLGAPLLKRELLLEAPHAGRALLKLEGLSSPVPLPSRRFPVSIHLIGGASFKSFSAGTGPRQRPAESAGP